LPLIFRMCLVYVSPRLSFSSEDHTGTTYMRCKVR